MTHPKPPRLTVPVDGTTDEKREAVRRLLQQRADRTVHRERSGKPPRPDKAAPARNARQQQVAAALGERIVPISALVAAGDRDGLCADELVEMVGSVPEINDDED